MIQNIIDQELFDSGCLSLIEAIVCQAAKDYLHAAKRRNNRRSQTRMREAARFFRSAYFRRLTGTDGKQILKQIRKEAGLE